MWKLGLSPDSIRTVGSVLVRLPQPKSAARVKASPACQTANDTSRRRGENPWRQSLSVFNRERGDVLGQPGVPPGRDVRARPPARAGSPRDAT